MQCLAQPLGAGLVKAEFLNAEYEHDDVERSYRFPLDSPGWKPSGSW